jgi:hypothetical protein
VIPSWLCADHIAGEMPFLFYPSGKGARKACNIVASLHGAYDINALPAVMAAVMA